MAESRSHICISFITGEIEHLVLSLLAIFIFLKWFFHTNLPFFKIHVKCFFLLQSIICLEFSCVILLLCLLFPVVSFCFFLLPFLISVGLIKFSLFHFFSAGVKFIYSTAIFYSIFISTQKVIILPNKILS